MKTLVQINQVLRA